MVCIGKYIDMFCERIGEMSTEEIIEISAEESTEVDAVVEVSVNTQILEQIYNDVHVVMVLTLVTFFMSCLRGWRKNTVKGAI